VWLWVGAVAVAVLLVTVAVQRQCLWVWLWMCRGVCDQRYLQRMVGCVCDRAICSGWFPVCVTELSAADGWLCA
jgi:hypothetical protein